MKTEAVTTNHTELKKKMLDAAIEKQQELIEDFKKAIKDALTSVGAVNEEEMDLSQQGFNAEITQNANNIGVQLQFANEEMRLLYDMLPTIAYINETIQPGSVVVTDKNIFFVSASIEKFEVEGLTVFGMSTKSPIYKAMQGKRKGQKFSFNKEKYNITDVF